MRSEIIQQRILQQNTEEESSSGPNTDPTVWFLVWIGALFLILMCPFLTNKRIRRLCYRRIVQRNRGNNDEEEEDGGDTFLPRARIVRSYPIGDPRHKFTLEEAEDETKKFILDNLEPYSKVLDRNDFDMKDCAFDEDIEGQTVHSSSSIGNDPANVDTSNHSSSLLDSSTNALTCIFPNLNKDSADYQDAKNIESKIKNHQFYDTNSATLKLPPPGVTLHDYLSSTKLAPLDENSDKNQESHETKKFKKQKVRKDLVSRNNDCSICLGEIYEGETVSWSALDCEHAFHQECIMNWLMTLGRKSLGTTDESILQLRLCRFEMKCPNCRQDFLPSKNAGA